MLTAASYASTCLVNEMWNLVQYTMYLKKLKILLYAFSATTAQATTAKSITETGMDKHTSQISLLFSWFQVDTRYC